MKTFFQKFGRAGFSASLRSRRVFGGTRYLASTAHAATAIMLLLSISASAQTAVDTANAKSIELDQVMVSPTRANSKTPVTFSNIGKEELEKRNLGQDIPILLNFMPSVVTTSDAGNGFGYTGIRVRGSDAARVNVTINGIPYNDSESSGTYWVNMPDFVSSVENIQLQRGVGTSTNGAGAFGASLNLLTERVSDSAMAEISNSAGSFNSRKHTVKFSTGLLNSSIEIAGRLSVLHSDGYIDRAESDLKSYFLQGTFLGKSSTVKALVFGGKERTYQAWNGIDAETLASDPTFNFAGIYTDETGNIRFYENEVDDYSQDHFQLHWSERVTENWRTNLALHYTIGKGYYENYKEDASLSDYGMTPVSLGDAIIAESDLVRRKWLDNDFYGTTFSANYKNEKLDLVIGGALNNYEGKHFGEVVWSRFSSASEPLDHYYDQYARKTDFNVYAKASFQVTPKWNVFGDLQLRTVDYSTTVDSGKKVDDQFAFFNPKAGVTYSVNDKSNIYFSYGRASKEPNRTDYENGTPKEETLDDFELGWRYSGARFQLSANAYLMNYHDQLVKTGAIDDIGNEIRANVDQSYRLGIELDGRIQLSKFTISPNIALSRNKIRNYQIVGEAGPTDYGTTNISFSPEVVGALALEYRPGKDLSLSLLTKHVGEQYAGNIDTDATRLESYTITDFNLSYEIRPKRIFSSILLNALINNVFDRKYVSNAYLYGESYLSYFPQAGVNFLAGATLRL